MSLFGSPAPGPKSSFRVCGGADGTPGLRTLGGAVIPVGGASWDMGVRCASALKAFSPFPPTQSPRVNLPGKVLEENAQIQGGSRSCGSGKTCTSG